MRDAGCVHIHMYDFGRGELNSARFLAATLPFSVSDVSWRGVATFPFSLCVFYVVDDSLSLLTLSDCVGAIESITKEMLTLCGKKCGSLIFNPVCPALP
jgi:hypothetical protein